MIIRKRYLERISSFIEKPVIKVISGIRRCGKSILMKQVSDIIRQRGAKEEQIIYINKELFEYDFIRTYGDLHKYVSSEAKMNKMKYFLFIDEIQEVEHWEKAVVSFLAEEKYDIYLSGSNARLMSSELATLLTGRFIEFRIYPLTFTEFRELFLTHHPDISHIWSDYLKYGGFPGLHHLQWEEDVLVQYLGSIYNTIVLKDIVQRNTIRDVNMLNRVLYFLADNCGNITSANSIRDFSKSQDIKISTDTILKFLQYSMDALLIHQVKRYDLQGKKILETSEKYFLSDTGFAIATVGNKPSLLSGKLENIVLNELLSRGYNINIGKNKENEIDFIAARRNEKLYLQVCASLAGEGVAEREYGAFSAIDDHFPKLVLSLDDYGWDTDKNGIKWMNIKDFLIEEK